MKKITLFPHSSSRSKQQAFTLIELLISVTIMAVLLAVGIVNYFRYLEKQRLYLFAGELEALVNDARVKARTGYLGDDVNGYCSQVDSVTIELSTDVDSLLVINETLNCTDSSVINIDSYTSEEVYSADALFSVAFSPTKTVSMERNEIAVNNMIITISSSNGSVVYNFAQGGLLTVNYD